MSLCTFVLPIPPIVIPWPPLPTIPLPMIPTIPNLLALLDLTCPLD